jgi:hypothetical protein
MAQSRNALGQFVAGRMAGEAAARGAASAKKGSAKKGRAKPGGARASSTKRGKAVRLKTAGQPGGRWPKEKEAIFFRELAIVCNVTAALRAAGLLRRSRDVYDRRSDPAFRARWEEALSESRVLMALELHERARFGDHRPEPANEIEAKLRAVPTSLAMQLLKLYEGRAAKAAAADAPVQRRDPERRRALRAELLERLAELNRRMGGEG